MPASASAAILAVQLLTLLEGPLVPAAEPPRPIAGSPPSAAAEAEAGPAPSWFVVRAAPSGEAATLVPTQ